MTIRLLFSMLTRKKENTSLSIIESLGQMSSIELLLSLFMVSSALIFFVLSAAYLGTTPENFRIVLTSKFSYSTTILFLSSYYIYKLKVYLKEEKSAQLLNALWIIIFAGGVFIFLQISGWQDLQIQISGHSQQRSYHFLYLISGFHLLHVVILMLVSFWILKVLYYNTKDPIRSLLFYTNSFEKLRLVLLAKGWSYLHVIWAILFTLFHVF